MSTTPDVISKMIPEQQKDYEQQQDFEQQNDSRNDDGQNNQIENGESFFRFMNFLEGKATIKLCIKKWFCFHTAYMR